MRPLSCLLALGLLTCHHEPAPPPAASPAPEPLQLQAMEEGFQGLKVRLGEATPGARTEAVQPRAEAVVALDDDAVVELLGRLPPLEGEPRDQQGFARRGDTRPPPLAGAEVRLDLAEAGGGQAPQAATGPLHVLRRAPEGPVPLAPHVSLTFDQPMVALTSQDRAARTVPVRLDPQPPGEWRWLGTRTLLFDPAVRLPMATEYTVTVEPGATSTSGQGLAAPLSWTFATPPVTVVDSWPQGGPWPVNPLLWLELDQDVDAAAVLPFVSLRGGPTVALRQATEAEIAADEAVRQKVEQAVPGRLLVLASAAPLAPSTDYRLVLGKGAPSAEGPRVTTAEQVSSFSTYDPLRVEDKDCSPGIGGCAPASPLWIWLNNPVDTAAFDPATVAVVPPVEHLSVQVSWNTLTITGDTKPDTTYTVFLPAGLPDAYGQVLGSEQHRSFRVGRSNKQLFGPGRDLVVLDPAAPPALSVYSVSHSRLVARVYAVTPDDFAAVSKWVRELRYDGSKAEGPPVRRLASRTLEVDTSRDDLVETTVDLSEWLLDSPGHLFVWVEPSPQARNRWEREDVFAWVQRTDIGLAAVVAQARLVAWATSLADGEPLSGVEVGLLGGDAWAPTDAEGLALVDRYESDRGPHALVARLGEDVALLPDRADWWNEWGSWAWQGVEDTTAWFVFDDRGMYRPGVEVRVKGWVRRFDPGPGGGPEGLLGGVQRVRWSATDAYGNAVAEGDTDVGEQGGFDLAFTIPDTPALGWASLHLEVAQGDLGGQYAHSFQIQEFRRPEFEVGTAVDPRPYLLGEHADVAVQAAYYAGGPLPGAPVDWVVSWSPGAWAPPDPDGFHFGPWAPWWRWAPAGDDALYGSATLGGKTDAAGGHHLRVDFLALAPPTPVAITAEATVTDVNRQRWSDTETLLLHPARWYPGLRTDRAFYEHDDPIDVSTVVVDLEGRRQEGVPVRVTLSRLEWVEEGDAWVPVERDPTTCEARPAGEPARCTFTPGRGGAYRLVAAITDPEGRPNRSTEELWVAGPGYVAPPSRTLAAETLELVPDRREYQPGDTAEILLRSPVFPATALVGRQRNGLLAVETVAVEEPTTVLRIPLDEAAVPNLVVSVDLVGSAARSGDGGEALDGKARRVAWGSGSVNLSVPPRTRTLGVEVRPRAAAVRPGSSTVIDVALRDPAGNPVQGEVAVVVADEAVLALSGYTLPDPLAVFYAEQPGGAWTLHGRDQVVLARPTDVLPATQPGGPPPAEPAQSLGFLGRTGDGRGEGGAAMDNLSRNVAEPTTTAAVPRKASAGEAAGDKDSGGEPVVARQDFSALALFAPHVRTDAAGHAAVPLDLPDSLTRYRVMAVAVAGDAWFGSAESTITAQLPLMIRPSPPRFLNFGDEAELPLVVQNTTDALLEVGLALRVANLRVLDAPQPTRAGLRFVVPARDRREVRVPVGAVAAGTARLQAVVAAGEQADAATLSLPVWTPATSEAFATYGELDAGAFSVPVEAPPDAWPDYGGLEITTSTTALQALTDAVLALVQYPHECSEQIASRLAAVAALRDVLAAFDAEGLPPEADLVAAAQADVDRLVRRQHDDGGWSFWPDLRDEPYLSVHVAGALVRARAKGFDVPEATLDAAGRYLAHIEAHIPAWYSDEARWTIAAYAVYVRHLQGTEDLGRASRLLREAGTERLPLEAQGWILPTLHARGRSAEVAAILRHLGNRVEESAAGAHWTTGYADDSDYVLLHSDRRTDGVLLEALVEVQPDSDLIAKVVRDLLGHRKAGAWSTTQENAFVLLALDRYFRTYEAVTPDLVARAWLGGEYVGEHAFRGRTTERATLALSMDRLGAEQSLLTLGREGEGRLYYRVGLRYAPRDLDLAPADRGFAVERAYEAVDDEADVRRDADGTWRIRAGARVRVRLTMVAESRRTHVALTDPLPSGLEPMNPDLAVTGAIPEDPAERGTQDRYWWWGRSWYEHTNLRDDRAEAYASLLWDGVHVFTYVATATTPGRFVVPPARAEEMYHPETFGRTATDRVIVE